MKFIWDKENLHQPILTQSFQCFASFPSSLFFLNAQIKTKSSSRHAMNTILFHHIPYYNYIIFYVFLWFPLCYIIFMAILNAANIWLGRIIYLTICLNGTFRSCLQNYFLRRHSQNWHLEGSLIICCQIVFQKQLSWFPHIFTSLAGVGKFKFKVIKSCSKRWWKLSSISGKGVLGRQGTHLEEGKLGQVCSENRWHQWCQREDGTLSVLSVERGEQRWCNQQWGEMESQTCGRHLVNPHTPPKSSVINAFWMSSSF